VSPTMRSSGAELVAVAASVTLPMNVRSDQGRVASVSSAFLGPSHEPENGLYWAEMGQPDSSLKSSRGAQAPALPPLIMSLQRSLAACVLLGIFAPTRSLSAKICGH
jgi:hypothetical protein